MKYRDEEFTVSYFTLGQYSANPSSLLFMKKESVHLYENQIRPFSPKLILHKSQLRLLYAFKND